jgi:hypothetical protein
MEIATKRGEFILEMVEVKCVNCNKKIYVQENYIREQMFCTLKCMDSCLNLYPKKSFWKFGEI